MNLCVCKRRVVIVYNGRKSTRYDTLYHNGCLKKPRFLNVNVNGGKNQKNYLVFSKSFRS